MAEPTGPITADRLQFENIEFVWQDRIPRKMITIVAGQPDQGKGLFGAFLAAQVSRGGGKVIYSAIEDGNTTMTGPRLAAAGARMENVVLWSFRLPTQLDELEAQIIKHKAQLVIIDPLASHLEGVKRSSDGIRAVSDPLKQILERCDCAAVIVEHAIKRIPASASPLSAIGGTNSGLPAAARAAYLFGKDPNNEEVSVLACVKSNAFRKPMALKFEIQEADIGLKREIPYLIEDGVVDDFDAVKLVSRRKDDVHIGRPAAARKAAEQWLTDYLKAQGGSAKVTQVNEAGREHEFTVRTLRRAAVDMGLRRDGNGAATVWSLQPMTEGGIVTDEDLQKLLGDGA